MPWNGAPAAPALRRQWLKTVILAARDLLFEWRIALCLILALAAVLAPLLVLFGLKSGIVTTMRDRLRSDPAKREVVIRGNHQFDPAWLQEMAARPDVGFLVPRTRTLNVTFYALETDRGRSLPDLDMIATGPGDPLLAPDLTVPHKLEDILLTATAAGKLGVGVGERLHGVITRKLHDRFQRERIPLSLIGIVPETALGRDAAFVSVGLLVAADDYKDGYQVPALGVTDGAPPRGDARRFANARLYARTLDDVAGLAEWLRRQGFDVLTSAGEIAQVRALDRVLTFVFLVLAGIGVAGYLLSLAASLWANVDRKRRDLALLRLVGLRTGPLVAFPIAQALIVACAGIAVSAAVYAIVAVAFNSAFATELGREEFVCRLFLGDGVLAAALTIFVAFAASLVGGYRAARIDPAESLREP